MSAPEEEAADMMATFNFGRRKKFKARKSDYEFLRRRDERRKKRVRVGRLKTFGGVQLVGGCVSLLALALLFEIVCCCVNNGSAALWRYSSASKNLKSLFHYYSCFMFIKHHTSCSIIFPA